MVGKNNLGSFCLMFTHGMGISTSVGELYCVQYVVPFGSVDAASLCGAYKLFNILRLITWIIHSYCQIL